MSAKTIFSLALVLTACSFGAVRAQTPYGGPNPLDTLPAPTGVPPLQGGPAQQQPQVQPSSWIRGDKYLCCEAVGGSGPILSELFVRAGASVPIGSGAVADALQTGLYLGFGGRVLFFDPAMNDAWTVELGMANISSHAHSGDPIALNILVPSSTPTNALGQQNPPVLTQFGRNGLPGVTLQGIEQTFANVGIGHEWYLLGSANCTGPTFRVGCDGGGRYGSEIATFHEIPHRTDTIAGLWAAVHADLEIPCGHCVFQAGFRIEYGYMWSDILQIQNDSDTQELNFIVSVGVRF